VSLIVLNHGGQCIVTLQLWVGIQPISSSHVPYPAYMHGPSCLPMATHCPGSPQDTCGPSDPPHTAYFLAGLLVRTPGSLLDQSFCQGSMHGGMHTIRDTGPNQEVGTTQASLAGTPPHSAVPKWHMVWSSLHNNTYEELVEGCGTSSGLDVTMGKWGATQVSLEGVVVVQTIGKMYIRPLVSQKQIILPLF